MDTDGQGWKRGVRRVLHGEVAHSLFSFSYLFVWLFDVEAKLIIIVTKKYIYRALIQICVPASSSTWVFIWNAGNARPYRFTSPSVELRGGSAFQASASNGCCISDENPSRGSSRAFVTRSRGTQTSWATASFRDVSIFVVRPPTHVERMSSPARVKICHHQRLTC